MSLSTRRSCRSSLIPAAASLWPLIYGNREEEHLLEQYFLLFLPTCYYYQRLQSFPPRPCHRCPLNHISLILPSIVLYFCYCLSAFNSVCISGLSVRPCFGLSLVYRFSCTFHSVVSGTCVYCHIRMVIHRCECDRHIQNMLNTKKKST